MGIRAMEKSKYVDDAYLELAKKVADSGKESLQKRKHNLELLEEKEIKEAVIVDEIRRPKGFGG